MIQAKLPVSVLILTQNEEDNIKYAIESVINDFDQIVIADSFSTDKTVETCKGYPTVEVYQNKFQGWAEQRNWMLKNCTLKNNVVFFLDADEYVDAHFINELKAVLNNKIEYSAIYLKVKYIFLNTHLKYAYGHPEIKRIFKKAGLSFSGEGAREYANVKDNTIEISSPIIHHDRKPISAWIDKHNKNSDREARLYFEKLKVKEKNIQASPSNELKFKLWIRNNVWDNLPLLIKPFLYFIYRYIFRLGILDGKAGLAYCFLHALWYQCLIDIKIIDGLGSKHNNEKQ